MDSSNSVESNAGQLKTVFKEIIQPFVDFARSPRALWGVNIPYLFEGLVYFGMLTLLAIFFNNYVGLNDHHADLMVGFLTGGITLSMFFLGGLADKWGIRTAMVASLSIMLVGRVILTGGAVTYAKGGGLWSPMFFSSAIGLVFVMIGYGIYQPAAYAAVRKLTSKKTASMGYAMLYALMNLGGFLPALISPPIRGRFGIHGVFWAYILLTVIGIFTAYVIITKKAVKEAIERLGGANTGKTEQDNKQKPEQDSVNEKKHFLRKIAAWLADHPLRNKRFAFFIFILIPVQTLFAHQWLTLPQYVDRAFSVAVSKNMEFFVNFNPLLIFILTPLVAAYTRKIDTYFMMILGTTVMALPTFLLALGTNVILLFSYIILMSIGEAMWQPRFLQWVAEIAPEGKTGAYMGIAQFPWFMTKVLTSLYAGRMLMTYIPQEGSRDPQALWFIYGLVALVSPICLFLARKWARRGVEEKH